MAGVRITGKRNDFKKAELSFRRLGGFLKSPERRRHVPLQLPEGGVPNSRHSWPLAAAWRTLEFNGFSRYQPPSGLRDVHEARHSNDEAAPSSAAE
jgi:hypothetical protein